MNSLHSTSTSQRAFTLIELLVVISIIAILAGLLLPVAGKVMDNARKTQAKSTEIQIVNAINAFKAEYGTYPIPQGTDTTGDVCFGNQKPTCGELFDVLQASTAPDNLQDVKSLNPRGIVYIELPNAKNPKKGFAKNGLGEDRLLYDPWGTIYLVGVDANYDDTVNNPYSKNAGIVPLRTGTIVYSYGKDQQSSSNFFGGGDKSDSMSMDDVISWQ